MKRFSKKMICNILICLIGIMILSSTAYGQNHSIQIPEKVKIGIRYGQSATPIVSLRSAGGFEFGYDEGNSFISLMNFGQNDIYIRKDSYFINSNGKSVEYDFHEARDENTAGIQGPNHIQIGNVFSSKQEAENFMYSLPKLPEDPYLVYENGWRVWVGMHTTYAKAKEACDSIRNILPNTQLNIFSQDQKRIQVVDKNGKVLFMYHTGPYYFKSRNLIQIDGKTFRGDVMIQRYAGSDLTVINRVNLTEYLYGVVPREVSGSWPIEAQKAQAVAARNYTILNLNKHAQHGFDLCASTHCQVYGGYDSEHPASRQAVDETKDRVLTYNGKLINAFYHSNSGGHTENAENVWTYPLDYIKGVPDPYSIGSPNDRWTITYTKQEIEQILASQGLSVGEVQDISILETSPNGRVLKLVIRGSTGERILEKEKIRSVFGYNNMKSTWFEVVKDSNEQSSMNVLSDPAMEPKAIDTKNKYVITASGLEEKSSLEGTILFNGSKYIEITDLPTAPSGKYIFNGRGWGHGLGMSQWGAKKMAEEGFDYKQILTYYYRGTKVE